MGWQSSDTALTCSIARPHQIPVGSGGQAAVSTDSNEPARNVFHWQERSRTSLPAQQRPTESSLFFMMIHATVVRTAFLFGVALTGWFVSTRARRSRCAEDALMTGSLNRRMRLTRSPKLPASSCARPTAQCICSFISAMPTNYAAARMTTSTKSSCHRRSSIVFTTRSWPVPAMEIWAAGAARRSSARRRFGRRAFLMRQPTAKVT